MNTIERQRHNELVKTPHWQLLNSTHWSSFDDVTGRWVYQHENRWWVEVLECQHVYTSIDKAFGIISTKNHFRITKTRKLTAKETRKVMNCDIETFRTLAA